MHYYLLNIYIGRVALAAFLDALCFAFAATATWFVVRPEASLASFALVCGAGFFTSFVALYYTRAYGVTVLPSARATLVSVVSAALLVAGVGLVVAPVFAWPTGAKSAALHTAGAYFGLVVLGRALFRWISARPFLSQKVLLVGTSDLALAIARALRERPNLGHELVGFVSDDFVGDHSEVEGYPVLGPVHEIEKVVKRFGVGRVVVASKNRNEYFPAEELLSAKLRGRRVESGLAFFERITGRIYLRELRSSYLIFSDGFRARRPAAAAVKRAFDLATAALGLVLASPLLGLAALAIKLDSRGPAFFWQERVGQDNRPFLVCKLRSMTQDAEANTGPSWSREGDPRITRVGRFLRRTRLDEIPQLWNVLRGDMSLVGPRPERPEFIETLTARYPYFRLRSSLKPGVTGWAQIRYGYVNDLAGFEEKLALDLYYMKYRSLAMDLLILCKTARTVALFHGV